MQIFAHETSVRSKSALSIAMYVVIKIYQHWESTLLNSKHATWKMFTSVPWAILTEVEMFGLHFYVHIFIALKLQSQIEPWPIPFNQNLHSQLQQCKKSVIHFFENFCALPITTFASNFSISLTQAKISRTPSSLYGIPILYMS